MLPAAVGSSIATSRQARMLDVDDIARNQMETLWLDRSLADYPAHAKNRSRQIVRSYLQHTITSGGSMYVCVSAGNRRCNGSAALLLLWLERLKRTQRVLADGGGGGMKALIDGTPGFSLCPASHASHHLPPHWH